jgi:hypothetical protein
VPWRLTISPISPQPSSDPYLRTRRLPLGHGAWGLLVVLAYVWGVACARLPQAESPPPTAAPRAMDAPGATYQLAPTQARYHNALGLSYLQIGRLPQRVWRAVIRAWPTAGWWSRRRRPSHRPSFPCSPTVQDARGGPRHAGGLGPALDGLPGRVLHPDRPQTLCLHRPSNTAFPLEPTFRIASLIFVNIYV